jgi:hypothetical protein
MSAQAPHIAQHGTSLGCVAQHIATLGDRIAAANGVRAYVPSNAAAGMSIGEEPQNEHKKL